MHPASIDLSPTTGQGDVACTCHAQKYCHAQRFIRAPRREAASNRMTTQRSSSLIVTNKLAHSDDDHRSAFVTNFLTRQCFSSAFRSVVFAPPRLGVRAVYSSPRRARGRFKPVLSRVFRSAFFAPRISQQPPTENPEKSTPVRQSPLSSQVVSRKGLTIGRPNAPC